MASPNFSINGGAPLADASVTASGSVVAILDSLDGVRQVEWSIIGTDETSTIGSYVLVPSGLHGSTVGTTALGPGTSAVLKCRINAGIDPVTEQPSDAMTVTAGFYVVTASGLRVKALGEDISATVRDVDIVNGAVRAADGAGTPIARQPVRAATTANNPNLASAAVLQDGVTLVESNRLLVKNQSTASENGVYVVGVVTAGNAPLTRASDFNTSAEAVPGAVYYVQEGTANGESNWTLTTPLPITLGVTNLTFENLVASAVTGDVNATPNTLVMRDGNADINARVVNSIRTVGAGTQPVAGVWIQNPTAATAVANQDSPAQFFDGFGWITNAGGSSVGIRWGVRNKAVTGTTAPTSLLQWGVETGPSGAGFTQRLRLNSNGFLGLSTDVLAFAATGLVLAPGLSTLIVDGSVATSVVDLSLVTSRFQFLSEAGASTIKAPSGAVRLTSATGNATLEATSEAIVTGAGVTVSAVTGAVLIESLSGGVSVSSSGDISLLGGNVVTAQNALIGGQIASAIHTQAFASPTLTFNFNNSNNQQTTLTGNTTIAFSNLVSGATYRIYLIQDGTGNRTVTWPATAFFGALGLPTLSTTAGAVDVFVGTSNGTNIYFEVSSFPSATQVPDSRAFALALVAGYFQQ